MSDVIVLKHYTCMDCGRVHTCAVRMPLEDWQAFRDALKDTGQRYTRVVGGEPTHHWHLDDLCLDCHRRRIEEEAEIEELLVPPVPQLLTWRQRIKRAFCNLFH